METGPKRKIPSSNSAIGDVLNSNLGSNPVIQVYEKGRSKDKGVLHQKVIELKIPSDKISSNERNQMLMDK